MFTATICGHPRMPAGLCTPHLHLHIVNQYVACSYRILSELHILCCSLQTSATKTLFFFKIFAQNNVLILQNMIFSFQGPRARTCSVHARFRSSVVCVFLGVHLGVINERSSMASAGHDSTTARKSFLLSVDC